jgi:hypothetical protein
MFRFVINSHLSTSITGGEFSSCSSREPQLNGTWRFLPLNDTSPFLRYVCSVEWIYGPYLYIFITSTYSYRMWPITVINFKVGHHSLFRFRILTSEIYESIWTFGRTPWTGDQPDARPLPTQDNTTQKNADIRPCLEQDSNPRSQRSSGRRRYVPLRPAPIIIWCWNQA